MKREKTFTTKINGTKLNFGEIEYLDNGFLVKIGESTIKIVDDEVTIKSPNISIEEVKKEKN